MRVPLVVRLFALLGRRRYDRELDDEVLAHLELAERDAQAAGMSPEEAKREARLRFGGLDVMKEEHRDRRSVRWIETFGKDVCYAFRSLRRDGTFSIVAIVVLMLAIGAGTTVFSVVDAVVLRGLPFEEHDRLAAVTDCPSPPQRCTWGTTTPQTFFDWRREQRAFSAIAAVQPWRFLVTREGSLPAEVIGQRVSHEFFDVLRVRPALGRTFAVGEEADGRHRVAILSHGFWLRVFGGDPEAIGRTFETDGETWEIVGVMPEGFSYPAAASRPTEIYAPIWIRSGDRVRGAGRNYNFAVIGRLHDDVSIAQAESDIVGVTSRLAVDFPDWFKDRTVSVAPLREHLVGGVRSWMLLLLGAVAIVLLIACANVANLMLARARETTVRAALGASRWRLVRGSMIEGLILSLAGATLGIVVACFGVFVVTAWLPVDMPRVTSVAVDFRVLTVAILVAVMTGVFFSIGPALKSSKPNLNKGLRDGRRSMISRADGRVRAGLVIVEVAFAVFLVIGASLFIGSLVKWTSIDLGFDHRNLIAMPLTITYDPRALNDVSGRGDVAVRAYLDDVQRRHAQAMRGFIAAIEQTPGVSGVAAAYGGLPLTGAYSQGPVAVPSRGIEDGDVNYRNVTGRYASVLGLRVVEGRYVTDADETSSDPVAVVNEAAARSWWPGESPVGQRMTVHGRERRVVGVVSDVRHLGPEMPIQPEIHLPMDGRWSGAWLLVRTIRHPDEVIPDVRSAIFSVNQDQAIRGDVFTLEAYAARLVAQRRFTMVMFALLGIVGLAIAAAGVYGVMAYSVSQRRQEIGVRMALGARPVDVVSMVLSRSFTLVAMGLLIGVAGAWYASSVVEAFLFELSPTDMRIYAIAIATIGMAGIAASLVPARRAAKVDPLMALRME